MASPGNTMSINWFTTSMGPRPYRYCERKEIKKWRRKKKNNLVMTMNPTWKDLSLEWEVDSGISKDIP
jgi:predicted GIY-YIG superfamily endonuclease